MPSGGQKSLLFVTLPRREQSAQKLIAADSLRNFTVLED